MPGSFRLSRSIRNRTIPKQRAAQEAKPKTNKASELVKIFPDGLALSLLKTDNAAINSLFLYDNNLLLGTGDEGILYRLGHRDSTDFLADLESSDILTIVPRTGGGVWMGSANPSSIHLLPVGTNDGGVYAVKPLDAGVSAQWGTLSWKASVPEGATLDFQTRSGNTEEPDDNWSDWSVPLTDPNPITSPPARYLQWRARFGGTQEGESATVLEVEAVYQKINQPPRITTSKVGNHVTSTSGDSSSSSNGRAAHRNPRVRLLRRAMMRAPAPLPRCPLPGRRTMGTETLWCTTCISGVWAKPFGKRSRKI